MSTDTAVLLVLADMQRTIEALRAENADLRQSLADLNRSEDRHRD